MTDFANYAFNKSHAAASTIVSYQTAYLKCYYPVEFMAALMTSVIVNALRARIRLSIQPWMQILPPDINEGESGFSVSGGRIRYGLSAIKSVGKPVIDAIVSQRNQGGSYVSLKDLRKTYRKRSEPNAPLKTLLRQVLLTALVPHGVSK